jgi:hypothetical protein
VKRTECVSDIFAGVISDRESVSVKYLLVLSSDRHEKVSEVFVGVIE